MAYDKNIKHWEIKDIINFNSNLWIRLCTIEIITGEFETTVMRSGPEGGINNLYIYFYNIHNKNKDAAIKFHNSIKDKLVNLSFLVNEKNFDNLIFILEKQVPELNRYKESIPYEYPKDIYGEEFRKIQ